MAHVRIEINGRQWFNADIDDFHQPPPLPPNPNPIPATALPIEVRKLLAKAMAKAMTQATGFKVKVDV